VRSWLLSMAGCTLLVACQPVQPKPYPIAVRVQSDPGVQLPGAKLWLRGATISETDEQGVAHASLQGAPGDVLLIDVACPEGYKSPEMPLRVLLKPLGAGSQRPEFQVSCPPLFRHVVVAVRTQNASDLPVHYLGREIARTDRSGAAHAVLEASPGDTLALTLNTEEPRHKQLMPQNPELRVTVPERDEIIVFDQQFTAPKPKIKPKPKKPKPALPIRF
jgi:hypothetical protein